MIQAEAAELHGLPVLVVDDNASYRRVLEDTLRRWGMKPAVAESKPIQSHELFEAIEEAMAVRAENARLHEQSTRSNKVLG